MSGKVIRTFILIFFLVIITIQTLSNNVTAIGEPEVSLEFGEGGNVQEASVEPGNHNPAIFQCRVSVQDTIGVGVQGVYIELESSSEYGWGSSVAPYLFYLYPGGSADFNVSVMAPFGTSSSIEDTVIITGYAEYSSGGSKSKITPIYGTIKIKPYHTIKLQPIIDYIKTSPGSEANFVLSIENNGNAVNRVTIKLEENDELEEKGYESELSDSTIVIPEKANKTIEITVIIPEHLMQLNKYKGYNIGISVFSEEQTFDERDHLRWKLYLGVYQKDIYLTYEFVISTVIIMAILISIIIFKRRRKGRRKTEK